MTPTAEPDEAPPKGAPDPTPPRSPGAPRSEADRAPVVHPEPPSPVGEAPLPRRLASLVKLRHTVFGLPFALAAAAVGHQQATAAGHEGLTWLRLALVIVAFTFARTAAMAFNRLVDRELDADNPRTRDREIPSGTVSVRAAAWLVAGSGAAFCLTAAALGPWPLALSPVALILILGYSYTKRVSWACHLVLGLCLSLAPAGAWVAVTGLAAGDAALPLLLMLAVASWVAGFDILYSLSDEAFDRAHGLHSIPVALGRRGALVVSAALHVLTAGALVAFHVAAGLGTAHAVGVAAMTALLAWEHWIVRPNDLSRLGKAFFDLNGWAALAYLAAVVTDLFVL